MSQNCIIALEAFGVTVSNMLLIERARENQWLSSSRPVINLLSDNVCVVLKLNTAY